jgi:hypothetical protein
MVEFKEEVLDGGRKKQITVRRQALTKEDAETAIKKNPLLVGTAEFGSIEEAAEGMLSNPDFFFQFSDKYGLDQNNPDDVKTTLMELMKPMAGYKANVTVKTPSKGINIYNQMGGDNQKDAAVDRDAYDEYAGSYFTANKAAVSTSVKGIGMIITPLKWGQTIKPSSAVYIDGTAVTNTTLKDANFSGITAIPYYMKGGNKVPINASNEKTQKIAGVEMFAMLELNQQTVFIPYQRTFLSSALQSGNKDEKFAVLNGAQNMAQIVALTNKKLLGTTPASPEGNPGWIELYKETFRTIK